MRSDRSVTGTPKVTEFESKIYLSPKGKPMMNQHVRAVSHRAHNGTRDGNAFHLSGSFWVSRCIGTDGAIKAPLLRIRRVPL